MQSFPRRTNPGVTGGEVQKKNRTAASPTVYNTARESPAVQRLKPGFGYRHVLRQQDVADFLRLLPDWGRLSRGLNAILLAPGSRSYDGWYRPGVVAVCAWERGLWREVDREGYEEHRGLFERLEVPCDPAADGSFLCKFTEPAVRAYQLLHVLLHELGHHHDRMTTRSQVDSCRGEGYAWEHERRVWDHYLAASVCTERGVYVVGRDEPMGCLQLPFFAELQEAQTVLIAGAGGGFDVFSGLPLYFGLRAAGKQVHLANLSFSHLEAATGRQLAPAALEVTADSRVSAGYFPEYHLCRWFRKQGEEVPIYCFDRTGFQPLLEGYRAVVGHLGADAVVLVDGGTDSLMRGDEQGLGTPEEDVCSLAAVDELDVPKKYLACLGFGVDAFHGVCHAHALEAVAELTREGAFLGALSLTREMPEVRRYMEAAQAVCEAMPDCPSIVCASILSALEGEYGDRHRTVRTRGSTLWINPLMAFYWCFRLAPVARRILYLDAIKRTRTAWDVIEAIDAFRRRCPATRPGTAIPDASFDRRLSR